MAEFYILIKPRAVYVKEGEFFRSQNGHRETWGKGWKCVEADSIEHARTLGSKIQHERHVVNERWIQHETFRALREMNLQRAARWHGSDSIPWTGADWSNAMCGEAGETANAVKKMRRLETRVSSQNVAQPAEIATAREMIAKEIGDTLIYLDLLAAHYSIDLGETVCKVFNQVSEREGFPERLTLT